MADDPENTIFHKAHRWFGSYQTPLMLKVHEPIMGYLAKGVAIITFMYVLWATITQHTYMRFDVPTVAVNPYPDSVAFTAAHTANKTAVYCNNPDYDYTYSSTWVYKNNQCRDTEGATPEIYKKSKGAIKVVTYYVESQLTAAGVYADEPANSYYFPHVEDLVIAFDHVMDVKGIHGYNLPTKISGPGKRKPLKFKPRETPRISVAEMLEFAGFSEGLDEQNVNSGGIGPKAPNTRWPGYRLTGLDLSMTMYYRNTNEDKPFEFEERLDIEIHAVTKGAWASFGPRLLTVPQQDGNFKLVERYEYGITVNYNAAGKIGRFEFFALLYSITVMVALVVCSKWAITSISHVFVRRFDDMKTFTENHWLAIEALTYRYTSAGWLGDAAKALDVVMEPPRDTVIKIAQYQARKEGVGGGEQRLGSNNAVAVVPEPASPDGKQGGKQASAGAPSPKKSGQLEPLNNGITGFLGRGSGATFFYNDL